MSKLRQSCHNWKLHVECNVLNENTSFFENFFSSLFTELIRKKNQHFGGTFFGRVDKTAFHGSRGTFFDKPFFRKTHISCQLWTFGWKHWHPEKNYRQGCWKCTLCVQGNDLKEISFLGRTFIFLSFWDFWTFGFSQRKSIWFFWRSVSVKVVKSVF